MGCLFPPYGQPRRDDYCGEALGKKANGAVGSRGRRVPCACLFPTSERPGVRLRIVSSPERNPSMKPKTLILMAVAVGCGLVAAFLATTMSKPAEQQQQVPVLVAGDNLMAGTKLAEPEKMLVP